MKEKTTGKQAAISDGHQIDSARVASIAVASILNYKMLGDVHKAVIMTLKTDNRVTAAIIGRASRKIKMERLLATHLERYR